MLYINFMWQEELVKGDFILGAWEECVRIEEPSAKNEKELLLKLLDHVYCR